MPKPSFPSYTLCFCLTTVLCLTLFSARPVSADDVQSLTAQDFDDITKTGIWFVEHFSPYCGHCQEFAPTWSQLNANFAKYRDTHNFYLAKVDCSTQGDLCGAHKVDSYPNIKLYRDGQEVDTFLGDRSIESISAYIETSAVKYRLPGKVTDRTDPDAAPLALPQKDEPSEVPNPDGLTVALTSATFQSEVFNRPDRHWFIKMYAPWCGHCKNLMPVWDQLAKQLKGKVNIGKVDCTVHKDVCTAYGVRGFPTLKYFTDGGASDFSGTRNIEDFLEFVEKASGSALTAIGGGDLTRIEKEKEIFFVYVYDNLTPEENMRTISNTARAFINQVPFYTTSDPIVAKSLGVVTPPAALILKDGRQHTYPAASFLFEDRLILKAWVKKEKFPALVGLTADNSEEILRGDRLVILSVLDTSKPQPFATQKELMKEAALKWKEIEEKEKRKAAVKNRKEVQFAWLDGVKWESYVKRVYGIRAKNLPALVITKPQDDEYFVRDRNNELLNLESDLIQAIIDAESGVLVPESTLSFPQRVVKAFVSFTIDTKDLAVNHWVWSAAVVVAGLAAMWRLSKPAIVTGAQRLQPSLGKVDGHRD